MMLKAQNLTFAGDDGPILREVSVTLAPGQFTALLGRNGAGKTTLLRLLLGLIRPQSGAVLLGGDDLARWPRRRIARAMAYVPQAHAPTFPYTVREIVGMGRNPARGLGRRLGAPDEAIIISALARLGLENFAGRNYASLSGGERQAVLLARALAQDARILILDEPAAALDLGQQARLMDLLGDLAAQGYAVLASLHQPDQALRWCSDALLLHDGRVLAEGAVDAVMSADNLSTLYGVPVRLLDAAGYRFAVPARPRRDNRRPASVPDQSFQSGAR